MEKSLKKFLESRHCSTLTDNNGMTWYAVKPICTALNIDFNRQWKNLRSGVVKNQTKVLLMEALDERKRRMFSISEKGFYFWAMNIRSQSEELIEFQKKCHEALWHMLSPLSPLNKKPLSKI